MAGSPAPRARFPQQSFCSRPDDDGHRTVVITTHSFHLRYLPVVDICRRLLLTSVLLAIPDGVLQLLVALGVSISFVVVFREIKPFFEPKTDAVFYVCGWQIVLCAVALAVMSELPAAPGGIG